MINQHETFGYHVEIDILILNFQEKLERNLDSKTLNLSKFSKKHSSKKNIVFNACMAEKNHLQRFRMF